MDNFKNNQNTEKDKHTTNNTESNGVDMGTLQDLVIYLTEQELKEIELWEQESSNITNNDQDTEQNNRATNDAESNPHGVDGTLPDLVIDLTRQEEIDRANSFPDAVLGSLG